ncbi:hypothetical protein WN944_018638 [Citrus x changshan-huyou]|uniref:U1-type domain-containing protein n=1 Tax=Citrus x changshan-huyou TaxID=2935761 RepID=A0AAP0LUS0_9ROSI
MAIIFYNRTTKEVRIPIIVYDATIYVNHAHAISLGLEAISSALPLQSFRFNQRKPTSSSSSFNSLGTMNYADLNRRITVKAITGSTSSKETSDSSEVKEEKSEIYSTNMTEAMGAGGCCLEIHMSILSAIRLCLDAQPKPDTSVCGSKQKAATPPAGSGELPSTNSSKPKEWSCALCQVTATTERGLDVHLQGKKHKAKEKLLRDLKMLSPIPIFVEQIRMLLHHLQVLESSLRQIQPKLSSGVVPSVRSVLRPREVWMSIFKVAGLLRDKKMCNNSTSSTSKISTESRDGVGQEMETKVQEESVKANKTVVGLNQKVEGGLDEHPQGKKQKAKEKELLGAQKWIKKSTESRDSAGQEMKTKVQEESVKANKTVVRLNQKVEGGLDEHPQGKKQKAKEEELLGAQKWIKTSTESRDSAGQEMKTKVEEESVKANRIVVGLDQKEEGCQALQVKPDPNLCGPKQEAATLPAGSGELPLTSSRKPMDWSCALCQVSTTRKRDLDEHLQGKKHKAKEEELLGDQKMCSNSTSKNSTESRDSAGQEIKATVEKESVKANKTAVGLDQKVEGGQDNATSRT